MTRAPDLGEIESYRVKRSYDGIQIGIELPERAAFATDIGFRQFRDLGILMLNIKVRNSSQKAVLLRRDDILLSTESGGIFSPLDRNELEDKTNSIFGIAIYPELLDRFKEWALPELSLLTEGQTISGYIYYSVDLNYDDAVRGKLKVAITPAEVQKKIEQEMNLGEEV